MKSILYWHGRSLVMLGNFFFENVNTICPKFNSMNDSDKFQYIMTGKDYDLNTLCISLCFELYTERNLLVNNTSNI